MKTTIYAADHTQTFISPGNSTKINCQNILVDHIPSLICSFDNDQKIAKLIKPRRPLEVLKMLIFRSRIHKELRGNKTLRQLGLNTPTIYQYGYGIKPQKDYRYIGFYTMDNLNHLGLCESTVLFPTENESLRQTFFENLLRELQILKQAKIVFSDLTLLNLFIDKQGNITWIDTGVTNYRMRSGKRFMHKFNFSIYRFIDFYEHLLLEKELADLNQLLFPT